MKRIALILTAVSAAVYLFSGAFAEEIPAALKSQGIPTEETFAPLPKNTEAVEVSSLITAIEIKGNQTVPNEKIIDAVFSKIGDTLIEGKVKADLKAIYALGYFSDVSTDFVSFAGGTKVIFTVKENPKLKDIEIEGNTVYLDSEIKNVMQTKVGQILNFKTLRDDINSINDLYHKNGYILARVIDVSTDEETRTLTVKVIEGIVESIVTEGNDYTQDYVILREFNTKPGDVLNENVLAKDIRRLFNLGFFSEVQPVFEPGSAPDKVILVVKVKETRSSTINFGGGYGERQGWFGFVDLSINNLLGTGQGLLVRGQFGEEITTYQFKYTHPWIFPETLGDRTSFTLRLWDTLGKDIYVSQQDEKRVGYDVSFGKPFTEEFKGSISYGNEKVDPYKDASFEGYVSTTVGFSLSYDTRDFWLNPTEGMFHTVSTRWGWKSMGDRVTQFVKYGLTMNQFVPLAERQTLGIHMDMGIGVGDVPISELYWAGGANSVRGYYPSDAHTGTKKLVFNIEYRYTFNEIFQGVLFYDYGDAWDVGTPDFADFLSGRGFGVRLNTPLGPIRLDYGIPSMANFGEGVTHFSIGQAF